MLCSTAAISAQAATPSGGTQGPTAELADDKSHDFANTADHVRIVSVDYARGEEDRMIVMVVIDPGFHINSNPASFDYLIPTTLTISNQAPVRVVYPEAVSFKPKFADQAINVYEGEISNRRGISQGDICSREIFVWHSHRPSLHR